MAKMILMMSLERWSVYCVCGDCCAAICEHGRALPKRGTDGLPSGERHDVGCTVLVVVVVDVLWWTKCWGGGQRRFLVTVGMRMDVCVMKRKGRKEREAGGQVDVDVPPTGS